MIKTFIFLTIIFLSIFSFLLHSCFDRKVAPPNKTEYTADELLKKMNEAINPGQLKDINSVFYKIEIQLPDAINKINKGTMEFYSLDNKFLEKSEFSQIGCDGSKAWSQYSNRKVEELNIHFADSIKLNSIVAWKDHQLNYGKIKLEKAEIFEGKFCYVLFCKNKTNGFSDRIFYVDPDTFLVLGTIELMYKPLKTKFKKIYHSYQKSENGILYADKFSDYTANHRDHSDIEILNKDGTTNFKHSIDYSVIEVKFNPIIDESIFQEPKGVLAHGK